MLSVIIPAHNEEFTIQKCLETLLSQASASELEVIVVCNGCSDNTADVARQFSGVIVEDTQVASKVAALNRGDELASHYPRAYLDADILVSADALVECAKVLEQKQYCAVAPQIRINTQGSSWPVKSFYKVWVNLPYFSKRDMIGSGLFILSETGRSRFGAFPNIIGDDAYVRALFTSSERQTVTHCSFEIRAPSTLGNLIKIKTRSRFGNMEIQQKYPALIKKETNSPASAMQLVLSKPWLAPLLGIYYYVVIKTIIGSKRRLKAADFSTWERDESTRQM